MIGLNNCHAASHHVVGGPGVSDSGSGQVHYNINHAIDAVAARSLQTGHLILGARRGQGSGEPAESGLVPM